MCFQAPLESSKVPLPKKCDSKVEWPQPSGSMHATYKRAAIATDHGYCSEIGR